MNFIFFLFKISIMIFIFTINNSISAELNELEEVLEVLNENQIDIYKNYSNVYFITDTILDDSITLLSQNYVFEESPGYIWRIIVPEDNHQILLEFQDVIVFNNSHKNCAENYIEIRNGLLSTAPLIQRICDNLPFSIYSIGRELYIKLVNKDANNDLQFVANLNNVLNRCHHSVHNCEHNCVNTFQGHQCACDEGFYLDSDGQHCLSKYKKYGTISHEKCKNTHDTENYNCIWKILAPINYRVILNFTHFNFDEEDNDFYNCSRNNHIKILQKLGNNTIEIKGPYCGTELPLIKLSRSNQMGIEFRSNKSALNSEFVVNYHTVKDECAFNNGGCSHECRKTITSFKCVSCPNFNVEDEYELQNN